MSSLYPIPFRLLSNKTTTLKVKYDLNFNVATNYLANTFVLIAAGVIGLLFQSYSIEHYPRHYQVVLRGQGS